MTKEKLKRILAFYLALNIIFEVVSPTAAYALTSGPRQPEMSSFEPVATTEMVDAFSGDFNYNIPLLTVPGPNGGYPVNLAYHAGIGMEDEASWVGLGWNINPGVIARQMRGLPDDFNGEKITKQLNLRPNRTVGINFGLPFTSVPEIWGFKLRQNLKLGAIWNNYKGFGLESGISISASSEKSNTFSARASLSYNSLSGETDLTAGFNLGSEKNHAFNSFHSEATINSLGGLKDLNFSVSRTVNKSASRNFTDVDGNTVTKEGHYSRSMAGGVTFASSSFVPPSEMPQTGFNINTSFSIGENTLGIDSRFQINAAYNQTRYPDKSIDFNAFGYLYADQRPASMDPDNDADNYRLMDFNREHEVSPSKDLPSLPAPISTYDVYMVNGQGIGGSFRPYRTDIGLLVDPEIKGDNIGGSIGMEAGLGYPDMNFGLNLALSYSKSYTGPWHKSALWNDIKSRAYKGTTYFKSAGEIVADENEETDAIMSGDNFRITSMMSLPDFSSLSLDPSDVEDAMTTIVDVRVNNNSSNGAVIPSKDHYDTKRTRSQLMSYKTFSEVSQIPGYQANWVDHAVYAENASPLTNSNLTNSNPGGDQIGEISVTNADGNHYIYALPAKNSVHKEVTFSIKRDDSSVLRNSPDEKIINYVAAQDNTTDNAQLDDHFFSSTSIPSYVHSYMLTAIVSPDYVDLTGDGLSNDDFGYWVKFNYTKTSGAYKWRAPFSGANYMKGFLSSDNDDKAGYTYGEKEIWYLNSIETKTHIANFTLDTRFDAKAVATEDVVYTGSYNSGSVGTSNDVRKLSKISLYSKADASKPLKEVNFCYTYDLCQGTLNSSAEGHGKLTLQKIWFSYLGNEKGRLSPYIFDYHQTVASGSSAIAQENPAYNALQEDRWGNYKENTFGVNSTLFPYTPQSSYYDADNDIDADDVSIRNAHASAWCLKEITLPSGGKIIVNYEADDYAYVHEKPAMEMARVIGFSNSATGVISTDMKDKNEFIFFEINEPDKITTNADVQKYVRGMSQVYFKIYVDLKPNGIEGVLKKDYVSGYAAVDTTQCGLAYTGTTDATGPNPTRNISIGYMKVNKVSIHDVPGGQAPYTHPFRKAAWQYLKLQRPDVLFPGSNNSYSSGNGGVQFVKQVANGIIGSFQSITELFIGYYSYCEARQFGKVMDKGNPSFIRLNTPDGIKYGGGHRVKKIMITDTWTETKSVTNTTGEDQSMYGQEYTYRLPDGRSSGVASYEPLVGGEEIPHRLPIRYSSPYFIFKNENLYIEEPVGESFYPGASVGYSRVIVKNIDQTETPTSTTPILKTRDGITINEFYTTKDFPYKITRNNLDHEKFNPKITIPFIGSVGFEDHGFSQHMNVITNDMHGKMKSVSTYDANADLNNPNSLPVSKVSYKYNTVAGQLSGRVNALFGDGYYRGTSMGTTTDQYIDMRETYGVSMNQGMQANVYLTIAGVYPIPVFIPVPIIDYSESLNKTVVAMNVTNQAGILMETRAFNEGSTVVSKNLMFDAYSGKPLLTSVTNDFDAPVYKYEYAARWAYDGMGNAYKNDRAYLQFNTDGSSNLVLTTGATSDLLSAGDQVLVNDGGTYKTGWVRSIINGTTAELVQENGNPLLSASHTGFTGRVMQSGRRNQQAISNGAIVSLSNPVTDRRFNLFTDYNLHLSPTEVISTDCASSDSRTYSKTFSSNSSSSIINLRYCAKGTEQCCNVTLTFPLDNSISWTTVNLKKAGNKVYALDPSTGVTLATGDIKDECGLTECMDGVLNASAAEFKDMGWTYDYADLGNPSVMYRGATATSLAAEASAGNNNPYRLGLAGIWRAQNTYAYQTNRLQNTNTTDINTTKIQSDGTFRDFALFNWDKDVTSYFTPLNQKWTKVNEVTKYSPYGFEMENKNAIGIFTSALYGYKNSVQTAIAANASYYETAYDGFEDYDATFTYYTDPLLRKGGHISLTNASTGVIPFSSTNAHTGKRSVSAQGSQSIGLSVVAPASGNYYFQALPNKKYTLSAWFKTADGKPDISVSGAASAEVFSDNIKIEGWQKVDVNFTTNSTVGTVSVLLKVNGTSGTWYVDDIRLQPFKSTLKTFVYDPKTLWLMAELDNQNYATFYNYDEEGTLTQVKKETINGVQTLKTTRSNTKRQ